MNKIAMRFFIFSKLGRLLRKTTGLVVLVYNEFLTVNLCYKHTGYVKAVCHTAVKRCHEMSQREYRLNQTPLISGKYKLTLQR